MKPINKGPVRRIRLRPVVTYPAVMVALASMALVLTPLGAAQGLTLAVLPTPTETTTVTTAPPAPVPTTVEPTTATTTVVPTTLPPTTLAPTLAATTAPGPVPNPTPGVDPTLAPAGADVPVDSHVLGRIEDSGLLATYLAVDAPVLDGSQFETFRVRFQLHNDGAALVTANPQLEYRAEGADKFVVVPAKPTLASAFHVAREWVPSLGAGGGTDPGPLAEDIAIADFKMPSQVSKTAVVGHHSMGANPDAAITLPAASYTEQEFTVRLSMDAKYLTGYELRVTDGGTALPGTAVAKIALGSAPPMQLSPGQRNGVAVVDPAATGTAVAAYPLLNAATIVTDQLPAPVAAAPAVPAVSPSAVDYPLTSPSFSAATPPPSLTAAVEPATPAAVAVASTAIHGPYDMTSGQCGTCHRGHAAQGPLLITKSEQSTLCFTCHDAAGVQNVKTQYDLATPNVPAEREYFSHDATSPATAPESTHTKSGDVNEFKDVLNRHSQCTDCHNPHKANASIDSAPTSDVDLKERGWSASGRLAGASGVSVENGAAGTAPTYTFLSGVTDDINEEVPVASLKPITLEYQLCFKCHSGFTTLLPKIAGKPSKDALDKAIEFNPANPSFHPVEAAGTNQTAKMTDSLAGTSPYKLWNFNIGSTVRCLNCHAGGATQPNATPTPLPLPGSSLQPHTSSNRGILLENYRDRGLKPGSDVVVGGVTVDKAAYNAGDFALCYVCHAEEPFRNQTANKTNFPLHGKHLTGIAGRGNGGTDIDKSGDGQGNAICAECHFRIHSTTFKDGTQDVPGSRLVSFSPNVKPYQPWNGALQRSWTVGATANDASCTLTCHGKQHNKTGYSGRQY